MLDQWVGLATIPMRLASTLTTKVKGPKSGGPNIATPMSSRRKGRIVSGLKPKDLCMVPNRLAIRLQEDGWYVRSEIIWHKPNPMPESVTDRPTSSHEKIWLLTKAERYWYDAEAIAENPIDRQRLSQPFSSKNGYVRRCKAYNQAGR
jgi:hypothetical protein